MIEVFIQQEREKVELPTKLRDRLYGNEAGFVVHRGCAFCQGTGKDQSKSHDYSSTLAEMQCGHCAGRGHKAEYLTSDELWQIFMPA